MRNSEVAAASSRSQLSMRGSQLAPTYMRTVNLKSRQSRMPLLHVMQLVALLNRASTNPSHVQIYVVYKGGTLADCREQHFGHIDKGDVIRVPSEIMKRILGVPLPAIISVVCTMVL